MSNTQWFEGKHVHRMPKYLHTYKYILEKAKILRINMFHIISHLQIYILYKNVSTMSMCIKHFRMYLYAFIHIYTHLYAFIHIYMVCTIIIPFVMQREDLYRFWLKCYFCKNAIMFLTLKSIPLLYKMYYYAYICKLKVGV